MHPTSVVIKSFVATEATLRSDARAAEDLLAEEERSASTTSTTPGLASSAPSSDDDSCLDRLCREGRSPGASAIKPHVASIAVDLKATRIDDHAAVLNAIEERCVEQSHHYVANVISLFEKAISNVADVDGLKRFAPSPALESLRAVAGAPVMPGEPLTVFHSANLPALSLFEFVDAIATHYELTAGVIAAALILFERYDSEARRLGLVGVTAHMMHRLLVACLLVAHKAHGPDVQHTRFGGFTLPRFAWFLQISPTELARLEKALLVDLDWRVSITEVEPLKLQHHHQPAPPVFLM